MSHEITIRDVMTPWAFWIGSRQTAAVARDMMAKYGIRHLPVQEGDEILGVLSEREVSFALAWAHAERPELEVQEICVPDPYVVSPDTSLAEVLETMVKERCDCALVREAKKLVGIFTSTDACRVLSLALRGAPVTSKAA